MTEDVKRNATARINRIAGQVAGIQRMVGEDRYCLDVLSQIAAVRSALDQLGVQLLTGHIEGCVAQAEDGKRPEMVEEIRTALSRFLK
jgi:DNA-binding FrmR family transcriptional regulator